MRRRPQRAARNWAPLRALAVPVPLWPCPYRSVGPDACVDLRRRGHRRLDRLFPQLPRRQGDRDRRHWPRLRRLGKSGGFLALDWCDGSPLAPLARRSFALHAELAEEIAEDWGYRRLDTYGGFAGFRRRRSAYDLGWLSDDVTVTQALGSPETTAQVHPGQFTAALMRAAEAQGAELRLGRVTGITQYESRATGVEVDGNVVEGDAIVIAMGPWSILAACWLPLPAVFGLKGHSLVFDSSAGDFTSRWSPSTPTSMVWPSLLPTGTQGRDPSLMARPAGTRGADR